MYSNTARVLRTVCNHAQNKVIKAMFFCGIKQGHSRPVPVKALHEKQIHIS